MVIMDINSHIQQQQELRKSKIQNSFTNREETLEKAKAHPVGTINKWGEMKMPDGNWKYLGKQGHSHPVAKELQEKGHYKAPSGDKREVSPKEEKDSTKPKSGEDTDSLRTKTHKLALQLGDKELAKHILTAPLSTLQARYKSMSEEIAMKDSKEPEKKATKKEIEFDLSKFVSPNDSEDLRNKVKKLISKVVDKHGLEGPVKVKTVNGDRNNISISFGNDKYIRWIRNLNSDKEILHYSLNSKLADTVTTKVVTNQKGEFVADITGRGSSSKMTTSNIQRMYDLFIEHKIL